MSVRNKIGLVLLVVAVTGGVYISGRYLGFFPTSQEREAIERFNNPPQADITWEEAVELVKSCEVKMVAQNHNRGVHLSLKDGTERTAIAPELDSIIGVGISCGDIIYAIE